MKTTNVSNQSSILAATQPLSPIVSIPGLAAFGPIFHPPGVSPDRAALTVPQSPFP